VAGSWPAEGTAGNTATRADATTSSREIYVLDGSVDQRALDSSLTDRVSIFDWNGVRGTGIFEFALTRSASFEYAATL
jgi:hypothetical protein